MKTRRIAFVLGTAVAVASGLCLVTAGHAGEVGHGAHRHGHHHAKMVDQSVVSEDHLAKILEHHPEADADGDGVLSQEEATAFVRSRHDEHAAMAHTGALSEEHLAMILEHHPEADTDEDGVLSKEEAKAFIHSLHGDHHGMGHADMLSEEHLAKILERHPEADTDEDGVLSKEEAKALIHARHRAHGDLTICKGHDHHGGMHHAAVLSAEHRAKILEHHPEADTDGDGVLSDSELETIHSARAKEHHALILERHPEADTDGDGILSEEEAKAFMHSRHGAAGDLHKSESAKHAAHGAR